MRRAFRICLITLALAVPERAPAQALAATAGAAGGLMGGVVVTMGWIVEQATFEDKYLHSAADLVSFTGAPLLIGPLTGAAIGWADDDAMWEVGAGAGVGLIVGAATGTLLGQWIEGGSEARWAGGTMGAAVGILAGTAVMVLANSDELFDSTEPGIPLTLRVPLP